MKKGLLPVLALIVGVASAATFRKVKSACEEQPQFYYDADMGFQPVYPEYYCMNISAICTYYMSSYSPVTYSICTVGQYVRE